MSSQWWFCRGWKMCPLVPKGWCEILRNLGYWVSAALKVVALVIHFDFVGYIVFKCRYCKDCILDLFWCFTSGTVYLPISLLTGLQRSINLLWKDKRETWIVKFLCADCNPTTSEPMTGSVPNGWEMGAFFFMKDKLHLLNLYCCACKTVVQLKIWIQIGFGGQRSISVT